MTQWIPPQTMVQRLYDRGLTLRRIARECQLTPAAIVQIAKGRVRAARDTTEQKLRALYDKYIGDEQ